MSKKKNNAHDHADKKPRRRSGISSEALELFRNLFGDFEVPKGSIREPKPHVAYYLDEGTYIPNAKKAESMRTPEQKALMADPVLGPLLGVWHKGGALYVLANPPHPHFFGGLQTILGPNFIGGKNARVYGTARVDGRVLGTAAVYGDARVTCGSTVTGDAEVFGDAEITNGSYVAGWTRVGGKSIISRAVLRGEGRILGGEDGKRVIISGGVGFFEYVLPDIAFTKQAQVNQYINMCGH